VARQSSQYNTSRTGRAHAAHIGLPQFLQYPVASMSEWTAHFIEFSLPSTHSELTARDKAEFAAEEGKFLRQHLEL